MLKNLSLAFISFSSTLLLLLVSVFYFYSYSYSQTEVQATSKVAEVWESKEVGGQVLGTQLTDKRPFVVAEFLKGTPLVDYSTYIVEISDKYEIDYRLIAAIAMKESGAGRTIREGSHNAWGFENGRTMFGSWEEAIDTVARTLKNRYIDKGLTTPDLMMPVYAPPAMENGGGWARSINDYFHKMEKFFKSI